MISYLIKTILCSGLLLLAYYLILEQEKMHRFNRFYLLLAIVFSFAVPLIVIEQRQEVIPSSEASYVVIEADQTIQADDRPAATEGQKQNTINNVLLIIYIVITALFLLRFAKNLLALYRKIKLNKKRRYHNAVLVLCNNNASTYSLFSYIFVDDETFEKGKVEKEIIHHEMAHVCQKHSLDIVLVELALCFCWFNPFLFAYKKAIRLNHEFLADDKVLKDFGSVKSYQHLLLNKISAASHSLLTSSFNFLTTKKRLVMMMKTTSPMVALFKQIILLPVAALMIFLFSTRTIAQITEQPEIKSSVKNEANSKDTSKPKSWWVGMSIGYTETGVPEEQIREYQSIVNKYKKSDSLNWKDFQNIEEADRSRMETIFKQMNFKQQAIQEVAFLKRPGPLPKVVPTKQQLESFKNPGVYGIWINHKKVSNEELNKYKNTDFSQVGVSKLYGAAKKGRIYSYQVDMMTNDFYKDYYNRTIAESHKSHMVVINRKEKSEWLHTIQ